MVCFRYIGVHTLHKGGGGSGGDGGDKTSGSYRKAISWALHIRKYKCKNTKCLYWEIAIHVPQIVNTEWMQHYMPQKHGVFQVCHRKYPA
jgi:hypothetical protein